MLNALFVSILGSERPERGDGMKALDERMEGQMMADPLGFEPRKQGILADRFSKPVPSTARPRIR